MAYLVACRRVSGSYIFRHAFERSSFATSGGTFVNFAYNVTKFGVFQRRDRTERIARADDPIASTANIKIVNIGCVHRVRENR